MSTPPPDVQDGPHLIPADRAVGRLLGHLRIQFIHLRDLLLVADVWHVGSDAFPEATSTFLIPLHTRGPSINNQRDHVLAVNHGADQYVRVTLGADGWDGPAGGFHNSSLIVFTRVQRRQRTSQTTVPSAHFLS